ncbi:oxidoreductase [Spartobacteria bacterium LR76]|nr:oxidoreductase [Spartobacteria bacterium LR76]
MNAKLVGKKAIVTSGGQGIGKAISAELIRSGCDLAIHYFSSRDGAEELVAIAKARGQRATAIQGDLTKEDDIKRVAKESANFLGGVDILVNNTGDLVARHPLQEVTEEFWQRVSAVNVTSALYMTRELVPFLVEAGGASVVNLSSLAGRKGGHSGSLVYSMCKGAILTMTRSLASELGPFGIRVNAVAPGLILETSFHSTHTTPQSAAETIRGIPLGRAGGPGDVARAVAFLASEYDGFITGATIDINGGVYSV